MGVGNPVNARHLSVGEQLQAAITVTLQYDAYTFDVTKEEPVSIDVTEIPLTSPMNLRVVIYGPDGTEAFSGINTTVTEANFTASSAGPYLMFVNDDEYNNLGAYTVVRLH